MEEEIMRNYTKEELNKIISEISNDIVEKNTQLLIDESAKCMMEEKSSADTICYFIRHHKEIVKIPSRRF